VSPESALQLHGLADVNPSRIHLTVRRDNHPRAAGGEMYRTHRRELAASDATQVDALPVTTVARTIRDCIATGTDPYQLRLAIDQAEAAGIVRRALAGELRTELGSAGVHRSARTGRASA
jgi:predicted transcriptional regulator of viral defense system